MVFGLCGVGNCEQGKIGGVRTMKSFQVGKKVWYLSGYRFYTGKVTKVEIPDGCKELQRVSIKADNGGYPVVVWDFDVHATDEEAKKAIEDMVSNLQGDLYLMENKKDMQVNWQNE
jgi:hypothetical protein